VILQGEGEQAVGLDIVVEEETAARSHTKFSWS